MLYLTIVPIDGGQFQQPFRIHTDVWRRVVGMHSRIIKEFQEARLIGEFFTSELEILPLPEAPTIKEVKRESMASLYAKAHQEANSLPSDEVGRYFNRFNQVHGASEEFVHFLVWLPPYDCEFVFISISFHQLAFPFVKVDTQRTQELLPNGSSV